MKPEIHPDYHEVEIECACGEKFLNGTTKKGNKYSIDVCNKCHPFYTKKLKHEAAGGRIDKFNKRYSK